MDAMFAVGFGKATNQSLVTIYTTNLKLLQASLIITHDP